MAKLAGVNTLSDVQVVDLTRYNARDADQRWLHDSTRPRGDIAR
ncbi:hypothetical protein [Sphingomonas sp. R86520]